MVKLELMYRNPQSQETRMSRSRKHQNPSLQPGDLIGVLHNGGNGMCYYAPAEVRDASSDLSYLRVRWLQPERHFEPIEEFDARNPDEVRIDFWDDSLPTQDRQATWAEIEIRDAIARVEADPMAGTKKYSHTMQTRRSVGALLALGIKRSDFRARSDLNSRGEYQPCIAGSRTREASDLITEHADALVRNGFTVHTFECAQSFITTRRPPAHIHHHSDGTVETR